MSDITAIEANKVAFGKTRLGRIISETLSEIEDSANGGKFSLRVDVFAMNEKDVDMLMAELELRGFELHMCMLTRNEKYDTFEQFLYISWKNI